MWGFAKAVLIGTLAAAMLPLCLTVPLGLSEHDDPRTSLYIAALPLIVAFPVVLGASTLIGLPAFLVLKRRNAETIENYLRVGVLAGLLLPLASILPSGAFGGIWFCALGAFSGGVTAEIWARWREQEIARAKGPAGALTNP